MKRLYIRLKSNVEIAIIGFRESNYDFVRFHLGTNSIVLPLIFVTCIAISFRTDVLNWNYLKGLSHDLSFFIGLFSIIFGVGFYHYWRLGEKSVYTFHLAKTKFMPQGVNVIYDSNEFSFAVSRRIKTRSDELSSITRQLLCIGIFLNLALITLDNRGFDNLKNLPARVLESTSGYCPDAAEDAEVSPPIEGCELIIRAYKLGYAKELGLCEPRKIDPDKMKVCEKRRTDEPYFHYMSRLLVSSVEDKIAFFDGNRIQEIRDKFDLQLQKLEVLKDYQAHAISASPRASHHIWTNLPYPENDFIQKYREVFRPNYCIEQFQNQTNTVRLRKDDERNDSKLLEHVYGQLLFNPKSKITVGHCKEYKIHWNAEPSICERLAEDPNTVLQEEGVLSEVELVLKRHDMANVILSLDDELQEIESRSIVASDDAGNKKEEKGGKSGEGKLSQKVKNKIVKSKIAKNKQQIRKKNELVSFQCFMQESDSYNRNNESNVKLNNTEFLVRTRYFPIIESKGESQVSMYREFAKVLEDRFYYSQLTSRSDINLESQNSDVSNDKNHLEEPTYLFSRLEMLNNVDIFLGNDWILERDDLLGIYPYHVHLQNYVKSFRTEYQDSRGRL
jgi:hypothetical protein